MSRNSIRLLEATAHSVRSALEKDHDAFGAEVSARIPHSFPPDLLDDDALRWTLGTISDPAHDPRWGMYWVIADDDAPVLTGVAGFKGKPSGGTVELGYGIVSDYQRRGLATAATLRLVDIAFASEAVSRVIAETLPGHVPSIGVLEKSGFAFIGEGSEPGVIRYERRRLP